ncbi:MAG: polysaccharide deacetylase family protein [Candidatus Saccharimonadales bacterium]
MSTSSQIFGTYPYKKQTSKKLVALTFDDGPNEPYTTEIADFLESKKIKATFFQVGECVSRYPDVTRRLYKDGHDIGNHSMHHRFRDHLFHPSYLREIIDNQHIIEKTIGVRPALFRSPWLFRQPWLLSSVKKAGLRPISGKFCHPFEVAQISSEKIARKAISEAKPGAIIIFHDGFDARGGNRSQTVKALKLTVNELISKGYSFVTISELFSVNTYIP